MAYIGNRMSVRALNAYENGAMPLSKWSKKEILDRVKILDPFKAQKLSKVKKQVLVKTFLTNTSWHHTGSFYNETNFYEFDEDALQELTDSGIEKLLQANEKEKKKDLDLEDVYFEWNEWEGSRKHPRKVFKSGYGVKKGNWIYMIDIYDTITKKKANGNWILKIEKVSHVSRETRKDLNKIKKEIK